MVVTTNVSFEILKLFGEDQKEFARVGSTRAFIEPAGAEIVAMFEEGFPGGKLFTVFIECDNIQIGDKLSNCNGEYIVEGVKNFESFLGKHSELTVRQGQ